MEYNDLSIVIVTYQSESKIFDCLKSIPKKIRIYEGKDFALLSFNKLIGPVIRLKLSFCIREK